MLTIFQWSLRYKRINMEKLCAGYRWEKVNSKTVIACPVNGNGEEDYGNLIVLSDCYIVDEFTFALLSDDVEMATVKVTEIPYATGIKIVPYMKSGISSGCIAAMANISKGKIENRFEKGDSFVVIKLIDAPDEIPELKFYLTEIHN